MSSFLMSSRRRRTPQLLPSIASVHAEIWPWAHSMIAGSGVAQLPAANAVSSNDARNLSRAMCQGPIHTRTAR